MKTISWLLTSRSFEYISVDMKAIGVRNGKGNADAMFVDDSVPDPELREGYILVSVKAFGLNRMDIMQREDRYPYKLLPESGSIMGVEFGGFVEAKGENCNSDFKEGDRVFGLAYGGAYAEKIAVSEKMLMHLPASLSFEVGAGIPEVCKLPYLPLWSNKLQTFFTAIQAIHLVGGMEEGQTVLIHAGASGVGQAAIQVAKMGGASKVIVTAGSDEKCKICKGLGAEVAVNYRKEDFAPICVEETGGKGINLIIDMVGRDYWLRNTQVAAMEGKIVIVASMSGSKIETFDIRQLMNKRLSLLTTTLRTRPKEYQEKLRDKFVSDCMGHFKDGTMRITIDAVYPWTQISEAHKRMEANISAGKIICTVDGS